MLEHIIFYLAILAAAILAAVSGFLAYLYRKERYYLHMMQQNSYMNDRFWRWLKCQKGARILKRDYLALLPIIPLLFLTQPQLIRFSVIMLATGLIYWLLFFSYKKPPQKKPLVMTARAKRLLAKAYGLNVLLALIFGAAALFGSPTMIVVLTLLLALAAIFAFFTTLLANWLLKPVERAINGRYYREAQRLIREMPALTTIAITGSYGKTSTKLIMEQILSEGYLTLATPESYNTPMGVTRIIRENLRPTHEVFIAEMGAKRPGDIRELCRLVAPKIGVLTAIGEQHLETFGSEQAIIDTKFELIEALPPDGLAVLNLDSPKIRENLGRVRCRAVTYGIETEADYQAYGVSYDSAGCKFMVRTPEGESIALTSKLLGKHNIYNILAGLAVARQMGLGLDKIRAAVGRIQPIQHRLQLLKNPQGFDIIDDAFNANPQGAEAALEVLSSFGGGKRVLLTPGMVELGEKQYQLNKEFALRAAAQCDYIILVGQKHSLPLQDGLKEAGYPQEKYYLASGLKDAWQHLQSVVKAGDTVLLENDLPDTYNE